MLGNIRFIGELGKLELLHEGILHKCIQALLSNKNKRGGSGQQPGSLDSVAATAMGEDIECLCQIMRTVGKRLDTDKARAWMDQYFERMKSLTSHPDLPSRIRFMLQDTIEQRNNQWVPRKILTENAPKTIQQVRREAAKDLGLNIPTPPSPSATMLPPAPNMDLFGRPINNGMPGPPRPPRMPMDMMFGAPPVPMSPPFMSGGPGIGTGPGTIHIDNFATGYGNRRGAMGGGNPNYRGRGRGGGGYNPRPDNNDTDNDHKFFSNSDSNGGGNSRQNNHHRKEYNNDASGGGGGGERNNYYRNRDNQNYRDNQGGSGYNNRDNNQGYNGRDNQSYNRSGDNNYNPNFQKNNFQRQGNNNSQQNQQQKDIDKLPPRFRKQYQMQQGGGGGGGASGGARGNSPTSLLSAGGASGGAEMNGTATPPMDSRSPSHTPPPPAIQQQQQGMPYTSKPSNEEINLRPANLRQFNHAFRPNIPSMLPKSTQMAQPPQPRHDFNKAPMVVLDPPAPVLTAPQIIPIKKESKEKKEKEKAKKEEKKDLSKGKQPTKEEMQENLDKILSDYLDNADPKKAVADTKALKPPKSLLPAFVADLISKTLDRSDNERDEVSRLMKLMKEDKLISSEQLMEGLNIVLNNMKSLEAEVPLVKSHMARQCAQLVGGEVVTLSALAQPMQQGTHYPLFLLCLQQIHKVKDKSWLLKQFNESEINLQDMLPECDREQERMMGILEDRGLSFLFPLLRIQTDLTKLFGTDPNPASIYKWIKENVDVSLYTDIGFIHTLVTGVVRYIVCESTLREGIDKSNPDKSSIEKEKELVAKYKGVLGHFLQDHMNLQIEAVYAMQVFVHSEAFPKGMLLRLFMQMYDSEVIDEEAFLKWKEEVNDQYPGKGKALFQVNAWLTWLEQAESESSDEDE